MSSGDLRRGSSELCSNLSTTENGKNKPDDAPDGLRLDELVETAGKCPGDRHA